MRSQRRRQPRRPHRKGLRARPKRLQEVDALHAHCGVYTQLGVVNHLLDAIGWQVDFDLSQSRLLEPAAGDGVFLAEAARRLIASFREQGIPVKASTLTDRIRGFEIHPREARRARARLVKVTRELGVHYRTANALARSWIRNVDFLLRKRPSSEVFTHAVGNPPYVRWAKIPKNLKLTYSRCLPPEMIGGDLFLPFLDRALEQLGPHGKCGFICSDRWRFMAFAEKFRRKWLPHLEISSHTVVAANAFVRDVDAYPSILVARRRPDGENILPVPAIRSGKTLEEFGFKVKVGPALGHTQAFVLGVDEHDIEPKLLFPWIDTADILDDGIIWQGRRVIAMNDTDGALIDPRRFPKLLKRLTRFESKLRKRSIVKNGAPWFRPIDRVNPVDWALPKLLIPEIAKFPRVAVDRSGAIPSHGIYAIFAAPEEIDGLYNQLAGGGLAKALDGIAPRIKGGYLRCYKRFLQQITLI
jgi:adenine-specific DNA-methyltransferase